MAKLIEIKRINRPYGHRSMFMAMFRGEPDKRDIVEVQCRFEGGAYHVNAKAGPWRVIIKISSGDFWRAFWECYL